MNRKFYLFFLALLFTAITITGVICATISFRYGSVYIETSLREVHGVYLKTIINQYRNDLLSGNLRYFRNQISQLKDIASVVDYSITQKNGTVDTSENYYKNQFSSYFFNVTVPIWFDETHSELWGEVNLLIKSSVLNEAKTTMMKSLLFMTSLVIIVNFILILVIHYFWKSAGIALNKKIALLFDDPPDILENFVFFEKLWSPLLIFLKYQKDKYSTAQKRIQDLEKQFALVHTLQLIGHDIRSPLSALNLTISTLSNLDTERREIIIQSLNRINQIAEDLLLKSKANVFKKCESSADRNDFKDNPKITLVNLSILLKNLILEKRTLVSSKNILIKYHQSDDDIFIYIDETTLYRILSNIITNSIESFRLNGGLISIQLLATKKEISIIVEDNGCGIPESILNKINNNQKVTHGKENGHGIGIFSSKMAVEAFSGSLEITSKVDIGTKIKISFPHA